MFWAVLDDPLSCHRFQFAWSFTELGYGTLSLRSLARSGCAKCKVGVGPARQNAPPKLQHDFSCCVRLVGASCVLVSRISRVQAKLRLNPKLEVINLNRGHHSRTSRQRSSHKLSKTRKQDPKTKRQVLPTARVLKYQHAGQLYRMFCVHNFCGFRSGL